MFKEINDAFIKASLERTVSSETRRKQPKNEDVKFLQLISNFGTKLKVDFPFSKEDSWQAIQQRIPLCDFD